VKTVRRFRPPSSSQSPPFPPHARASDNVDKPRHQPPGLADFLALADRLARLRPDWTHPEAFFEARSDLVAELRRLAREAA
ncbi:hypothetical protein, partial [Rhodovastum atsumiense]|uniref:hypothetical protein n=1 Tax=Rhodovastum atsumiense TaxID=504468 RepID=UPI00193B43EE